MAVKMFCNVRNKNVEAPRWPEHPYGPDQVQVKGYIVPIKDLRNLNITFPMPDLHEHYKSGVSIADIANIFIMHCNCFQVNKIMFFLLLK